MSTNALAPEERVAFADLADILIPAYRQMPAASVVAVHGALLDQVLASRPDILEDLARGIRNAEGRDRRTVLTNMFMSDTAAFDALGLAASAAYYMSPVVWELLGYPGQENAPFDAYETPEYETSGLLDRVRARGPIYRPTPR